MPTMRRILRLPEEILFFGRLGAYGLIIGTIYWFVTYETAGTVLLVLFGGGSTLLAAILLATARRETADPGPEPGDSLRPDGPFGDESGRIPGPSLAPIEVGLGLALASLGIAFGPWFLGGRCRAPRERRTQLAAERYAGACRSRAGRRGAIAGFLILGLAYAGIVTAADRTSTVPDPSRASTAKT